jgi:CheY-like chemotaxis protein
MAVKKKILIVEDDKDQCTWLSTLFEDNGYETITAPDGQAGFQMAKDDHPDLITLDISMPEESGIKMYRNLHEDNSTSNIPVIMITGVSPEFKKFIERRKQVNPPAGYFEKPVEQEALLQKVRELIG